ncbi:GNAT family N-acetyltransferase [Calidifontibacillus oryziterrae]|uniref:GNAT family N-acetyltransferase n=1 Tax=Calidifontibacillus oryziterrae TaxID=1191699 RepID=UPI0002FF5FEB|nr:GNAT family N-acetyltransferase [Calidifontibacillus oryziterrae]
MEVWEKNGYSISTKKNYLNINLIHKFLSYESYWSQGVPKEIVTKAIENTALCFGIYKGYISEGAILQVGFARVITDSSTFAYLADVFVLEDHRKLGLSKWLMEVITTHHDLQGVRRFMLATNDAHTLYSKFGFEPITRPQLYMEKVQKNPYRN